MCQYPDILILLAKQRQAEYVREAQQFALAERAARASGKAPGLISRLVAAWGRLVGFVRASNPLLSERAPR